MSDNIRVIQLNDENSTSLTYDVVANYINSGVLGDVYRLNDGRVAKIPRDANRLPQFDQEVAVLSHLATSGHTPQIVTGTEVMSQSPAIIMPYYKDENLYIEKLAVALNKGEYVDAEKLTLTLAIAFCKAMIQLHTYTDTSGKKFTCVDRKVIDFYVENDKPPMIIDWNVLSEDTPDFRVGEIRVFGGLLHEAYLGAKGKVPYEPFNDSRWRLHETNTIGVMSVGLRYILARMTGSEKFYAQGNTEHFEALKTHLEAWQTILNGDGSDFEISSKLNIQNNNEISAIVEDLRVRLGIIGNPEARTNAMKVAHEAGMSDTEKTRNQILNELRLNVADATKLVNNKKLKDATDPHLKRWDILLFFNDDGFDSRKKADIRAWLASVGGGLHTDKSLRGEEIAKIRADYDALRQIFPNNYTDIYEVDKEIQIHEQAEAFNSEPSFTNQIKRIQELVWNPAPPSYMTDDMLNRLLDGYSIHKLVNKATNEPDLDAIKREFALIEGAVHLGGRGTWLNSWLNPIYEALRFINDYNHLFGDTTIISREAILKHTEVLRQKDVLLANSRPLWNEILRDRINLIADNYYNAAIDIIRTATEDDRVNFDDLLTLQSLVNKLGENIKPIDKTVVDKFDDCLKVHFEFMSAIEAFLNNKTKEHSDKLNLMMQNPLLDKSLLDESPDRFNAEAPFKVLFAFYHNELQAEYERVTDALEKFDTSFRKTGETPAYIESYKELLSQQRREIVITIFKWKNSLISLRRKTQEQKDELRGYQEQIKNMIDRYQNLVGDIEHMSLLDKEQKELQKRTESHDADIAQLKKDLLDNIQSIRTNFTTAYNNLRTEFETADDNLQKKLEGQIAQERTARETAAREMLMERVNNLEKYFASQSVSDNKINFNDVYGYLRVGIDQCPPQALDEPSVTKLNLLISTILGRIGNAEKARGKNKAQKYADYEVPRQAFNRLHNFFMTRFPSSPPPTIPQPPVSPVKINGGEK